jgi:hypothetical protein
MRVAFLANSFHLTMTKSSDFFIELLRKAFDDVHVIPLKEAWAVIPRSKWDLLVVWMALVEPRELEAFGVPRVVLVPMSDYSPHERVFWTQYMQFNIFSLSATFLDELQSWGLNAFGLHYYPTPSPSAETCGEPGLRGFFWPRTRELGWSTIRKLIGNTPFESFHVHWARELNPELADLPTAEDAANFPIQRSSWFDSRAEYENSVRQANVYFAPRTSEGIGMSYLEALSWGLCVVASDAPTMNEYIVHGVNGLLYNADNPVPLDFSNHEAIGREARDRCERGRKNWEDAFEEIKSFLQQPGRMAKMPRHPLVRVRKRSYVTLRAIYRLAKRILYAVLRNRNHKC